MFCEALAVRIRDDVAAALELPPDRGPHRARAEGARRDHDHRPCLGTRVAERRPVRRRLARAAPAPPEREVDEVPARRAAGVGGRDGLRARAARSARRCSRRSHATTPAIPTRAGSAEAFAAFAARRFGWDVDPARVRLVADVMTGGGGAPAGAHRARRRGRDQPARLPAVLPGHPRARPEGRARCRWFRSADGGRLDLDGLERAFAAGPGRTCSATRTTPRAGRYARQELDGGRRARGAPRRDRDLRRGARADDDAGRRRTCRIVAVGEDAVATGVAVTSASKAWNLAGLKCAVDRRRRRRDARAADRGPPVAPAVPHRATSACSPRSPRSSTASEWLDALVAHLDRNRALLGELLARPPAGRCGYVAAAGRATSPGSTAASSGSATTRPRRSSSGAGSR